MIMLRLSILLWVVIVSNSIYGAAGKRNVLVMIGVVSKKSPESSSESDSTLVLSQSPLPNETHLKGDDAGFETQVYNNTVCKTPYLDALAKRSVVIRHAFTSVSSCSPSRSAILTGLPQHQNGMYGLHHAANHFNSFDTVRTMPQILKTANIKTGIIGKKHVGPDTVYKFDYEQTEENNPMLQVARNITFMKLKVREFLDKYGDNGFLLYIGFNDVHRCGGSAAIHKYGQFCEKFGDGVSGLGVIADWKPVFFKPAEVVVPPFLPDTPATRADLAAQYTSVTRMDAGFKDNHRCEPPYKPLYGEFCEKFGNGVGVIPDWQPVTYDPASVVVPFYLPDTMTTRQEIANLYTIWSRMDAGIGMLLSELQSYGYLDETLVIFTADNGIPFPNAKTNLYEPGMGEPMLVSSPIHKQRWGQISEALTSTTDIVPTVLDWFNVSYPDYNLEGKQVKLTGKSMLPLLQQEPGKGWDQVYASHDMHEVTMFYPMRVMRTHQYRLVHNLNNRAPYPLATDLYACPTFQDILNHTRSGEPTHWFKDLKTYYYRPEYELFDIINDPQELNNLADNGKYSDVMKSMMGNLMDWRLATNDPWKCYPHGVISDGGQCGSLDNEIYL